MTRLAHSRHVFIRDDWALGKCRECGLDERNPVHMEEPHVVPSHPSTRRKR